MRQILILSLALAALAGSAGCRSRRQQGGTDTCVPGSTITVACSEACGVGACNGDPILRVCDGSLTVAQCEETTSYLAENDDDRVCASSGYCSRVSVTCPDSGTITVAVRGFGDRAYDCAWDVQ